MNRKTTPDILSSLMGESVKPETHKAIKPESNKPIKPESNKPIKQVKADRKEKATFNLHKSTLNALEEAWGEIRRLRGDKRVSRSDIVNQAIEEALTKNLSKFYFLH